MTSHRANGSDSAHEPQIKGLLKARDLQALLEGLIGAGYRVVGPVESDGAIVLDDLTDIRSLPAGVIDRQKPGSYRLAHEGDGIFDHVVGQQNWKKVLYPAHQPLWSAEKSKRSGMKITRIPIPDEKLALIGVRGCDLAAIDILDHVLAGDSFTDARYVSRRENSFVVAVNCRRAAATCFCASMGTGPKANGAFDIRLTELSDSGRHVFLVETGSSEGDVMADDLPLREAKDTDVAAAEALVKQVADNMERSLDVSDIREVLFANLESEIWDEIADRCLACTNCTLVCPTCFCTTVEDVTDLTGSHAERHQKLDSCFTQDFSYIHGGSIRTSFKSRYRQWLTHKLASWIDQFGMSGCVGCGRCITWCPVGIDLTEEVPKFREAHALRKSITDDAAPQTSKKRP